MDDIKIAGFGSAIRARRLSPIATAPAINHDADATNRLHFINRDARGTITTTNTGFCVKPKATSRGQRLMALDMKSNYDTEPRCGGMPGWGSLSTKLDCKTLPRSNRSRDWILLCGTVGYAVRRAGTALQGELRGPGPTPTMNRDLGEMAPSVWRAVGMNDRPCGIGIHKHSNARGFLESLFDLSGTWNLND